MPRSLSKYRSRFYQIERELIEESLGKYSDQVGHLFRRMYHEAYSLHNPEEVWQRGEGKVKCRKIERFEKLKECVEEALELIEEAHGKSRVTDHKEIAESFKEDLGRLDLEPSNSEEVFTKELRETLQVLKGNQSEIKRITRELKRYRGDLKAAKGSSNWEKVKRVRKELEELREELREVGNVRG